MESLIEDVKRSIDTFGENDALTKLYLQLFAFHRDRANVANTLFVLSKIDQELADAKN